MVNLVDAALGGNMALPDLQLGSTTMWLVCGCVAVPALRGITNSQRNQRLHWNAVNQMYMGGGMGRWQWIPDRSIAVRLTFPFSPPARCRQPSGPISSVAIVCLLMEA